MSSKYSRVPWACLLASSLLVGCTELSPEEGTGAAEEKVSLETTSVAFEPAIEWVLVGPPPSFSLIDTQGPALAAQKLWTSARNSPRIADLSAALASAEDSGPMPRESLSDDIGKTAELEAQSSPVGFLPRATPSAMDPGRASSESKALPAEDATTPTPSGSAARSQNPIPPLYYPADIMAPAWLEERRRQQLASAGSLTVRHDFRFHDQRQASGIRFHHQVTEDSAKHYKTNHYDHGSGVVLADVDGDDRLDIYFVSQVGFNELWRNLGSGRFEDITESAGVGLGDRIGVTAAFADIDNDSDADLFVTTVRGGNVLLLNDGHGHFEDVSEASGLGAVGHASGAAFFDYDRDGLLDLLVTNVGRYTTDEIGPGGYFIGYQVAFDGHLKPERSEPSRLYRNLGNHRFVDVSERTGFEANGWNGDAVVLDVNEDGWPDIFLTDMQGHDDYFENQAGQRFVNRSQDIFPVTPFGTMGVQALDFDNDGGMDIFLTDMHTDMVRKMSPEEEKSKLPGDEMPGHTMLGTDGNHVFGNAFFHRLPDGGYEEISDQVGAENYWPWGLSRGDLNADGFEDVFITASMSYGWRYAVNSLLLNDRGRRFHDSEMILGLEPRAGGLGIPWFEIDCSGEDRDHFHCADRVGPWEVWGALGSRSSVIWDLDDDGDLDILTNDFGAPPMVLISDLADRHTIHYLKIRLRGTTSNRDALGASVVVHAGDRSWRKVNDGKSGYLSFSRMPLYFGLDDLDSVDRIEIQWPSGHRQTVLGPIAVDRQLEIVEEGA